MPREDARRYGVVARRPGGDRAGRTAAGDRQSHERHDEVDSSQGDELIRHATDADKPRLIEMAARFLLETPYGRLFDERATPMSLSELIGNVLALGVIFVAEVSVGCAFLCPGCTARCAPSLKLVGMLAIVAIPHPMTGRTYADEIAWWVEPEHRHGTLGPKMLREAEDWAISQGANMLKMVAPAGSTVGRFYEHVGYRPVETAYIKLI